jgi:hypothetical protein
VLKDEQFEEDKEKLADFYRNGSGKAVKVAAWTSKSRISVSQSDAEKDGDPLHHL